MTLHFSRVQPPDLHNISLYMDKELAATMNQWRLAQPSLVSPTEAIYELLRRALRAEGYDTATEPSANEDAQVRSMVKAFQSAWNEL